MKFPRAFPLALLALHAASANAYIDWMRGCSPGQVTQLEGAIDEAIRMATSAVVQLTNFAAGDDATTAALMPLFLPSDVPKLAGYYSALSRIRTSGITVRFYCSEQHVSYNPGRSVWQDNDYEYVNQQGARVKAPLSIGRGNGPNGSPGTIGSYTTLGFKPTPNVDFSDQSHIFINSRRFGTNPRYDTRSFDTIKQSGLMPNFNSLDNIKPLTETVFHELVHAVGGSTSPSSNRLVIGDGPTKSTYGYQKCVQMNFDVTIGDPISVADCITIAAKAMYLQISNANHAPTYWSTGTVDPTTLQPIDLPSASGTKARRQALAWIA